mgnify:FL=1
MNSSDSHVKLEYGVPLNRKDKRLEDYYAKLLEERKEYTDEDFDRICHLLEEDCSQFLDELKKTGSDLIFRVPQDANDTYWIYSNTNSGTHKSQFSTISTLQNRQ